MRFIFNVFLILLAFYILTSLVLSNPEEVRAVNTALEKGANNAIDKGQRAASELSK